MVSKLSEIWSGLLISDPDPGSRSWLFTHPGSRIQGSKKGTGSGIRNTDRKEHWKRLALTCVRPLMLYDNILGVGLEVAELALEALDLGAVLAGDVDAELDLGGECLPAVGTEDVAG